MTDETAPNSDETAADDGSLQDAVDAIAADTAAAQTGGLEELQTENAELKDRVLRIQAELENFRRRSQKESLEAMKYQALPVIRDLLPGIDNLKRAVDAAEQSGDTQNLIDGIKMVSQQFADALKAHSAEPILPEGEAFDPNLHEAMAQVPSADHEPMTVLQVVEAGYRIHDRVVRPAKVMVSCAPPPAAEESATDA